MLLTVEEEYTTPLPDIVVGNASDRGSCFERHLSMTAQPSSRK